MPKNSSARIEDHFADLTDPRRRPVLGEVDLHHQVGAAGKQLGSGHSIPGGKGFVEPAGHHKLHRAQN